MTDLAIGFIGLGIMGTPMAGHLMRAGHRVVGYDIVPSRVEALVCLLYTSDAADDTQFV